MGREGEGDVKRGTMTPYNTPAGGRAEALVQTATPSLEMKVWQGCAVAWKQSERRNLRLSGPSMRAISLPAGYSELRRDRWRLCLVPFMPMVYAVRRFMSSPGPQHRPPRSCGSLAAPCLTAALAPLPRAARLDTAHKKTMHAEDNH